MNAGGGAESAHPSNICGSPKNAQRKSCQFFVTFPKYVNGVLETTFCSQITFGLAGRWQKWSKLAYFCKGGPCREQYGAKIINTYKCQLQHVRAINSIAKSNHVFIRGAPSCWHESVLCRDEAVFCHCTVTGRCIKVASTCSPSLKPIQPTIKL